MASFQEDMQQCADLQNRLMTMTYPQVKKYIRDNLQRNGTDVTLNDQDPQGDGDQTMIRNSGDNNPQFYRDLFATGGDINHLADLGLTPLSGFAKLCISGDVQKVQEMLVKASQNKQEDETSPRELLKLLETRETSLRLSPLLMIVSMGKNLVESSSPSAQNNAIVQAQIKVAKLLLEYGARPDARDVCGKTVCHYGMGAMATEMTIQVCNLCIKAHESSYLFNQKVELCGLANAGKNGQRGLCGGYLADSDRRAVYRPEEEKTISIKPENLNLLDNGTATTQPTVKKLCDIPDRLGAVCLLEVIPANRVDVARVLLKEHQAALDIADCDGVSPRSMSINTAIISKVAGMINQEAGKRGRVQQKITRKCANCGEAAVFDCSRCTSVSYCGKDCQTNHWKKGGHKKACKELMAAKAQPIVLDKPPASRDGRNFSATINIAKRLASPVNSVGAGYRKPTSVGVDEKFYLKVQGGGPQLPLLLYDKTRQCEFDIHPGDRNFEKLRQVVAAEPTWQGRKTYISASFDKDGNCSVYPTLTTVKSHW